jgi:nitroreductase
MDVVEAILARYSVREFNSNPLAKETVMKILEVAIQCPSSGNTQPWELFVATGATLERIRLGYLDRLEKGVPGKVELVGKPMSEWPDYVRERMTRMRMERFKTQGEDPQDKAAARATSERNRRFFGAPVLIILCMDRNLPTTEVFDIGLLSQNILITAQSLGLGSIIATGFVSQPDILHKELAIPDNLMIVTGIALGYANTKSIYNVFRTTKRPVDEVVNYKS